MAVGGPAIGFTAGLLEGLARARQHAIASNRFQVEFALKQLKERKQEEEAIRKEWAAYQKAQIEYAAAQRELDLATEHRRQVETSTGKPYRDAAIEGRLAEAHERLDDAHNDLQERQGKLQDLISERDARVRGALKSPMAPKIGENVGGLFGSRVGRHAATEDDRQKAIDERKAEIRKGEMEQQAEFNKSANPVEREIRQAQASESMENAKIKGFETAEEEGRKQQGPLNEETRRDKLYASDKEIEGIRQRRDVYNASMEAAAQEIQRRQAGLGPMPIAAWTGGLRCCDRQGRRHGRPARAHYRQGRGNGAAAYRHGGPVSRNGLTWRFPRRSRGHARILAFGRLDRSRHSAAACRPHGWPSSFPGCREASADAVAASHCDDSLCAWGHTPGGLCGQGQLWSGRHGAGWHTLAEDIRAKRCNAAAGQRRDHAFSFSSSESLASATVRLEGSGRCPDCAAAYRHARAERAICRTNAPSPA